MKGFIGKLVATAKKYRLTLVKVEDDDVEVEFEMRHANLPAPTEAVSAVKAVVPAKSVVEQYIRSNLVGYFRSTAPVLASGESVSDDTIIGTVEALGLSNDLPARVSGRIAEVLVSDGQAVEYGQPIAKVEA